jgi:hypothetical protein
MEKETSAYINMLTIEYARRKGISDAALFNGIEKFRPLLENPDEWISMELCTQSLKNFEKAGGNCFEAGLEITKAQVTHFQLVILKIAPLPLIIKQYARYFEKTITPHVKLSLCQPARGVLDVILTPVDKGTTFSVVLPSAEVDTGG